MIVSKQYILIAEGITDCSFLEAVLEKYLGFSQYQNVNELPLLFQEMIGKYPAATGELQRQDSPTFFHKNGIGVAIKQAGGCSKIPALGRLRNYCLNAQIFPTTDYIKMHKNTVIK